MLKELAVLAICSMMAVTPAAEGSSAVPVNTGISLGRTVETANPFTECRTLGEAAQNAGFGITVPDKIEGYTQCAIRTIQDQMIEIVYSGSQDGRRLRIRKTAGTGDISGDYTQYREIRRTEVDGRHVILRGDDSKVNAAVWTDGGFSFSVGGGDGMSSVDMQALIQTIK